MLNGQWLRQHGFNGFLGTHQFLGSGFRNPSVLGEKNWKCASFASSPFFLLTKNQNTLRSLINGHARLFISEKFSTLDTLIKAYPFISFWKNFLPPRLLKPTLLLIHLKFPSSPFSRIEIQFSRRHFQYKQTIKRPFNTYMTVKWALIFDRRCESS